MTRNYLFILLIINFNHSLATNFTKFVTSKSIDFNSNLFEKYKSRWLEKSLSKKTNFLAKHNLQDSDLCINSDQDIAILQSTKLPDLEAIIEKKDDKIKPALLNTCHKIFRMHGLNPSDVIICMHDNQRSAMFTYASRNRIGKHLLSLSATKFNPLEKEKFTTCDRNQRAIENDHFFRLVLAHETAHIINLDSIKGSLAIKKAGLNISSSFILHSIMEQIADTSAVFNSPNPVGSALYMQNDTPLSAHSLYDHRNSYAWQEMIDDIKSCYSKKWHPRMARRVYKNGKAYYHAKIEHLEE